MCQATSINMNRAPIAPVCRTSLNNNKKRVRCVSFTNENTTHEFEATPADCKNAVYYNAIELKHIRRHEVVAIKHALEQLTLHSPHAKSDDIESDSITWRGIEDYQRGTQKNLKMKAHMVHVVREWHRHANNKDHEGLRHFSKYLSKEDRTEAQRLAKQDATFVSQHVIKGNRHERRKVLRTTSKSAAAADAIAKTFKAPMTLLRRATSGGSTGSSNKYYKLKSTAVAA